MSWETIIVKTPQRGLLSGFVIGFVLSLMGIATEDMLHGTDFYDSITDLHHMVFPLLMGCLTGFIGYRFGKVWQNKWTEAEQLALEKNKYRTLTENLNVGIFRATASGNIVEFNSAVEKMFGYSRGELLSMNSSDLYENPETRKMLVQKLKNAGFVKNEKLQLVQKDGRTFAGSLTSKAFKGEDGEVLFFDGIVENVDEQTKTLGALIEAKEKFRQVTEQSPSVYELYDIDGLQIEVNKAYETLWDFPEGRSRTVGKFNVLKSKEVKETGLLEVIKKAYNGETMTLPPYKFDPSGETESGGAGRVRWLNSKIYPLKDIKGNVTNIVITHEDISERMYAEEENRILQAQIVQTQKMESIGRLAGGIAHDFNNILSGVLGYAELLKMNLEGTENEESANIIMKGVERASNLTKQLLGFAREGKYDPKPLNINDVIVDVMKVSEKILDKNIHVEFDFDKNISTIEADKNQVDQVLTNLIINARDAMPKGGNLHFKTESIFIDKEYVNNHADFKEGHFVKVSVTDTGSGMSEDVQKKIFEPFFTTKPQGKGTGLGLATVYGIIKNHGGSIHCYSETGEGTAFSIYLPVSGKEISDEIVEIEPLKGDATILIVDDEENIREMCRKSLENLGYTVLIAEDGMEGIRVYQHNMGKIDLVLLDMIMPNMAGREAFNEMKVLNPEVKAILISGYSQDGRATDILKDGVSAFIQKPFKIGELTEIVNKVLMQK